MAGVSMYTEGTNSLDLAPKFTPPDLTLLTGGF